MGQVVRSKELSKLAMGGGGCCGCRPLLQASDFSDVLLEQPKPEGRDGKRRGGGRWDEKGGEKDGWDGNGELLNQGANAQRRAGQTSAHTKIAEGKWVGGLKYVSLPGGWASESVPAACGPSQVPEE